MSTFTITWVIDIDAPTAEDAAIKALEIQRDPLSTATFFAVLNEDTNKLDHIDVMETYYDGC